jgi:hypothetical protein
MPEWLSKDLAQGGETISHLESLWAMLGAAFFAALIGLVYLRVHPGKTYGRSLVLTQVTLAVVIASVLKVIGDSVAVAFGAFGILGLVRFRTDFPDPRDTASVLSSVAVGMACGLSQFRMAVVATMVFIAIQGAGWLWSRDADDEYWRDIAMRGRRDRKDKKEKGQEPPAEEKTL